MSRSWLAFPTALVLVVACSTATIIATYSRLSQTWDEGIHVDAGLEFLQYGRYTHQTENPPLARVVLALWPYLNGARTEPAASPRGLAGPFYRTADYRGNLTQARVGNLLFFWACVALTWILAGGRSDPWVALLAAAGVATLPAIVGHAGIATTDIGFLASALLALVAFRRWLLTASIASAGFVGAAIGIAVATKFSTLAFLPPAIAGIFVVHEWDRWRDRLRSLLRAGFWSQVAMGIVTTAVVIWAAYAFHIGRLSDLPQSFPPWGAMPTTGWPVLIKDWRLPGHEFIHGLLYLESHRIAGGGATLLGQTSARGFWMFYPVVLATKTPLPFLLFVVVGIAALMRYRDALRWRWAAGLALGASAVLLVAMTSPINMGVRHVLVIYPLASIAAAFGIVRFAERSSRGALIHSAAALGIALQLALMTWSMPHQRKYFNVLAGSDPAFVTSDSDFDWGDHGFALEEYFSAHPVPELYVELSGTTRTCQLTLPPVKALPDHPVAGWIAISDTPIRRNRAQNLRLDPCDGPIGGPRKQVQAGWLTWLKQYQPVATIGKTVLLYHVPPRETLANGSGE